jgi:hypothetical protein
MQQETFTLEQAKLATSWVELVGEYEVEKQCAQIATWLKRYCGVSGSAFFLQDSRLAHDFRYADTVPEDVLQNLQGLLPHLHQAVDREYEAIFLAMSDEGLAIREDRGHDQSLKQVILATILSIREYPIGTVALVAESDAVQSLLDEENGSCWFGPLIANLLDNAISHEEKSKKISRLNLYQTVSSSLAYAGGLHELLRFSCLTRKTMSSNFSLPWARRERTSRKFDFLRTKVLQAEHSEKARPWW